MQMHDSNVFSAWNRKLKLGRHLVVALLPVDRGDVLAAFPAERFDNTSARASLPGPTKRRIRLFRVGDHLASIDAVIRVRLNLKRDLLFLRLRVAKDIDIADVAFFLVEEDPARDVDLANF